MFFSSSFYVGEEKLPLLLFVYGVVDFSPSRSMVSGSLGEIVPKLDYLIDLCRPLKRIQTSPDYGAFNRPPVVDGSPFEFCYLW